MYLALENLKISNKKAKKWSEPQKQSPNDFFRR